jgi:hypothetical protein
MDKLNTVDTEALLEEILSSAESLKHAAQSQKKMLDSVSLNQLERLLLHKNVLIDKIRSIQQELKTRGLELANRNGNLQPDNTGNRTGTNNSPISNHRDWGPKINGLRREVERTVREIIALETDSQKQLLNLKQHVRKILLDIQNRRKMLRGYAIRPPRNARILDTKT